MKIVLKLNQDATPTGEMLVWLNGVPVVKRPKILALQTYNGIPAEVVFAAACKGRSCDCAARFGQN